MNNPSQLLPLQFNSLQISPIDWSKFRGQIDDSMPWSAHIYWWIEYNITDQKKKKIQVKVYVSPKSWVREENKCDHLLNHEQNHYLIGCICALEFMRRIDSKKHLSQEKFDDLLLKTFQRTMKEYIQLQKKYDNQTQHRLNYKKQEEWDTYIYDKLSYYKKIYDKSKKKFVRLNQSQKKSTKQ